MNKKEYLLNKLQEECAEVIQIAAKYKSFGPDSFHPDDPNKATNQNLLGRELMDLMAVIHMVGSEGLLPPTTPQEADQAIQAKLAKVEYYMQASRDCGCLDLEVLPPEPATD